MTTSQVRKQKQKPWQWGRQRKVEKDCNTELVLLPWNDPTSYFYAAEKCKRGHSYLWFHVYVSLQITKESEYKHILLSKATGFSDQRYFRREEAGTTTQSLCNLRPLVAIYIPCMWILKCTSEEEKTFRKKRTKLFRKPTPPTIKNSRRFNILIQRVFFFQCALAAMLNF